MEKVREIIRLKEHGLSERAIQRATVVSRPVVRDYIAKVLSAGLDYAALQVMDDASLLEVIAGAGKSISERYETLSQKFDYFVKELKRPGVTLGRLWQEYRAEHAGGYSYSQFCYHFQLWRNTSELTMHIEHKAGDKMFVDFAGKKLHLVDRNTGARQEVETFVAILGASQYTYAEATASQKKTDVIHATQNAFHYYGGVPGAVVPDCLKAAVTTPDKYEPGINPEYADFACHYNTVILPARPNRPKDKALVEGAVRLVYNWIYAALRNRTFTCLAELNQAILAELHNFNARPMQKLGISRQAQFEQIEKAALAPLPAQRYHIRGFKSLKVPGNYHIFLSDDKHHYSVPYRYRGRQVKLIYTDSVVEIFYNNQRLAWHKRNQTANGYTTIKEHMPAHHQAMDDCNPQRLINWASTLGEHVEALVSHILAHQKHPEQAYKRCLGILNLSGKTGIDKERLNKACKRALDFQNCSLKGVQSILANKLEDQPPDVCEAPQTTHENIRGRNYYCWNEAEGGYHR